ncbi:LIMLP_19325 family protein, partial [Leptospira interrogans]
MVINYFNIKPLDITESELDEYEKYIGIPLQKEDREAILKSTGFRKALAIINKHSFNALNHSFSDDLK